MSAIEVKIPTLGESIQEGVIARWLKNDGDSARMDEGLVELETDKASVEIPAPQAGILRILKQVGETVKVGEVVARLEEGDASTAITATSGSPAKTGNGAGKPAEQLAAAHQATVQQASALKPATQPAESGSSGGVAPSHNRAEGVLAPTVRKLVAEHDLDAQSIAGTGPKGRVTQQDVLSHLKSSSAVAPQQAQAPTAKAEHSAEPPAAPAGAKPTSSTGGRRVPMTRLRQRIAERLVQAQHTAAILTTFNEVDMSAVMDWRSKHKERFQKTHGIALGFVSFFAKASAAALKDVPIVGAQVDGTDIVYPERLNLGVAVATDRGLVVPVVHNADDLDIAGLEKEIARLAALAREGKLSIPDLSGGTFSISNGGVFGSLLSTPILNPPQSGILGMHKIEKRPVVVDDQIVIRPMMYVALSYDHRIIDGSDAVTFLVKVKERLEDPSRLLLNI